MSTRICSLMDPIESIRLFYHGTVPFAECTYLMGIAVLSEHLKVAAQFIINGTAAIKNQDRKWNNRAYHSTPSMADYQESLAFVQGSGLNLVMESYGLEGDPEEFKETFFDWCQYQRRKKSKS